jgi:hypothetical protein
MRSGKTAWVVTAILAAFLVGCQSTGTGESGESIFGDVEGEPDARIFPETWGGWIGFESEYSAESDSDEKDEIDNSVSTWSNRAALRLDGPTGWPGGWLMSFLVYDHVSYDWDDDPDLFDDARYARATVGLVQGLSQEWVVALFWGFGSNTESGADFGEGFSWWLGAGAFHLFNEDLGIGAGAIFSRNIHEEWSVIPGIQGFWNISEDWQLRAIATRAELRWQVAPKWLLFASGEIDSGHFLIDEIGDRDDIVVSDFRIPVTIGAEYYVSDRFELELQLGFDAYREFTFDLDGDDEEEVEFEGSFNVSGAFTWWF